MAEASPDQAPEIRAMVEEILAGRVRAEPPAPVAPVNGYPVRPANLIDIDAQLALIDTSPQPVRLGGHTYMVRRDFRPAEAARVMRLAVEADDSREKELQFWAELVGDDAQRMVEFTDNLEQLKVRHIVAQLAAAAGLGSGALGEA